ncbi:MULTISPECIES: hypothetical protein [unclassified Corynebacterium]|uniref:hypothetical protein n=1 Tax=unclassified Corynebacterium TaxID=2624378 RepID=UPI003523E143
MKVFSRKSLIAAATTIALSASVITAPAFADDDDTNAQESSVSTLTDGSSEKSDDADKEGSGSLGSSSDKVTYTDDNGKTKQTTKIEYYAKQIGAFVKMLTTIASLFTAIYSISNAIQKLAPKA